MTTMMISHAEANEMHLCIGLALLGTIDSYSRTALDRALEIAAIVVNDTNPERDKPVIIPIQDFAEYDAHLAPHLAAYRQAARDADRAYREDWATLQRARNEARDEALPVTAYRQAARDAERTYSEDWATLQRARDEAMYAAAAAYEAATGRSCPDPDWRVMA